MIRPKHLGAFLIGLLGIMLLCGSILVRESALLSEEGQGITHRLYKYWPHGLITGLFVFLLGFLGLIFSEEYHPELYGINRIHLAIVLLALLGLGLTITGALLAGFIINFGIMRGELVFSEYWDLMMLSGIIIFIAATIVLLTEYPR